jgi:hypothetical protein
VDIFLIVKQAERERDMAVGMASMEAIAASPVRMQVLVGRSNGPLSKIIKPTH